MTMCMSWCYMGALWTLHDVGGGVNTQFCQMSTSWCCVPSWNWHVDIVDAEGGGGVHDPYTPPLVSATAGVSIVMMSQSMIFYKSLFCCNSSNVARWHYEKTSNVDVRQNVACWHCGRHDVDTTSWCCMLTLCTSWHCVCHDVACWHCVRHDIVYVMMLHVDIVYVMTLCMSWCCMLTLCTSWRCVRHDVTCWHCVRHDVVYVMMLHVDIVYVMTLCMSWCCMLTLCTSWRCVRHDVTCWHCVRHDVVYVMMLHVNVVPNRVLLLFHPDNLLVCRVSTDRKRK